MKTIIFTLLMALCCCMEALYAQNRQADSLALVSLYQSTNGAQWTSSWDLNQSIDTWYGVQLDNNGRVYQVELIYNGLSGTLPTQLNLSEVTVLHLRGTGITGGLPDFVGMPKLIGLDISGTRVSGTIPNFSNLPKLIDLIIQGNQLSGAIPDFTNLPDLSTMILDGNQLGGMIPDFSNLSNLLGLSLARNGLGGPVPDFSNLPFLDFLRLNDNKLSGTIPNFSNLPRLESIRIARNQLSGSIPNFSNLPLLDWIDLSDNKLTGSIPNFRNTPNLQDIWLRENQLTGSIPNFSSMPLLLDIKVENNQLTGNLPAFNNCPDLEKINVSKNQLEGRVPIFSAANNLEWLFLEENQFTFEDIVPGHNFLRAKIAGNLGNVGYGFRYNNQDSVGQTQQIALPIGVDCTLDLGVDAGVSTNIYYWYKDGIFIDSVIGSNQYTITNFQAIDVGNYSAQIANTRVTDPTEPNHHLRLYSRTITLDIGTSTTTVPKVTALVVYPNPSSSQIHVELPQNSGFAQLQLINTIGQVVHQEEIMTTNKLQLALKNYTTGLYWIRLTNATGQVWQASVLKK